MKNLIESSKVVASLLVGYMGVDTFSLFPIIEVGSKLVVQTLRKSRIKLVQRSVLTLTILSIVLSSCGTMNKTKKGAVIGTVGGGAIGAVVGKAAGNTVLGAIIGAAVGGTAGVLIGHKMDKQAEDIKKDIPNAKVERVGEGIVIEFSEKILFGYNESSLKADSRKSLDDFVAILKKYPNTNIEIQGHTDSKGSETYNLALSNRRAEAVQSYLMKNSIASSRIVTKGMGEAYPKTDNDTEAHRAENRRVEFLISANETMKTEAKTEAGNGK